MSARHRSPAEMERRRVQSRERRARLKAQAACRTAEELAAFIAQQKAKAQMVIQPSVSKQQTARLANVPGETVEEWIARGGQVETLPGYTGTTYTAGLPVRSSITGARGL